MLLSIIGVMAGLVLYSLYKTPHHLGIAIPLFLTAPLCYIGFRLYTKSDILRIRYVYAYDMSPSLLRNEELPRIKKTLKYLLWYRVVAISLLISGACIYGCSLQNCVQLAMRTSGITLACMALVLLTDNLFAEKRARRYTKALEQFVNM